MSKTILYARVSTTDQTIDHQAAQARAAGFKIDEVVADEGVSGVRTRSRRDHRGAGCSTCCALVTRWSCAG